MYIYIYIYIQAYKYSYNNYTCNDSLSKSIMLRTLSNCQTWTLSCAYCMSYIQGKQILIERMKLYSIYKALGKLL